MEEMTLFDFLPDEEAVKYKPKKSTDWKWTMANDYPKKDYQKAQKKKVRNNT